MPASVSLQLKACFGSLGPFVSVKPDMPENWYPWEQSSNSRWKELVFKTLEFFFLLCGKAELWVLRWLQRSPVEWGLVSCPDGTGLTLHPLLPAFSFPSHFPSPLPVCPGIISQINYLHLEGKCSGRRRYLSNGEIWQITTLIRLSNILSPIRVTSRAPWWMHWEGHITEAVFLPT